MEQLFNLLFNLMQIVKTRDLNVCTFLGITSFLYTQAPVDMDGDIAQVCRIAAISIGEGVLLCTQAGAWVLYKMFNFTVQSN